MLIFKDLRVIKICIALLRRTSENSRKGKRIFERTTNDGTMVLLQGFFNFYSRCNFSLFDVK